MSTFFLYAKSTFCRAPALEDYVPKTINRTAKQSYFTWLALVMAFTGLPR